VPYMLGLNLAIFDGGVTSIADVESAALERYTRRSRELKLPDRCPIANVYRCPRFFLSVATLTNTAFLAGMSTHDIKEARDFWKQKTTIPPIAEEEPCIDSVGPGEEFLCASSFCPEVAFRAFGVFASYVSRWGCAREDDKNDKHKQLRALRAKRDDWRWVFSDVAEKHYTECEEWPIWGAFRPRTVKQQLQRGKRTGISQEIRWEVFDRDSYTCQYCGRKVPEVALEIDHRIPVAKGGTNDPANLVTSCKDCNRAKRDKVVRPT